jgi:hypothetical protein
MGELLEKRLDEHKYEMWKVLQGLQKIAGKDIINYEDTDYDIIDRANALISKIEKGGQ